MAEMVLPDVYIEVRAEGLIVPGQVSVGNIGIVGTASKGPIGVPVILGSYSEALQRFGPYDKWVADSDELTLVRALELAYGQGATTVFAVRVASSGAAKASRTLASQTGDCVGLTAKSAGTWGNGLEVNVFNAEEAPVIDAEGHTGSEAPMTLSNTPVVKSARNRVSRLVDATGVRESLQILYDDDPAAPTAGKVKIDRASGELTFGDTIEAQDKITATYLVDATNAVTARIRAGTTLEVYTALTGDDLADDVNARSALIDAEKATNSTETPAKSASVKAFAAFSGGKNGESGADYAAGLATLLNENCHIMLGAGQDDSFGDELDSHCQNASTDLVKRDRIAVVGSRPGATVDDLRGHTLSSDRVIFTAPGIVATDSAATPPVDVTLPGAYTAAAVAGLLARSPAHVSPTNKVLRVGGLERIFTAAELAQLVGARILMLERRTGFRIVKGITTSAPPFQQITTRRIVDYAKFGIRSAAEPYIGLLNNTRVRAAMRATINSFLADMVLAEMLTSYELDVTATRDEERRGIARVTTVLRPTFSIDFITVTMFLE